MDFEYEFYSEGFFGYSQTQDFEYFSFWHFLPIIVLVAAILLVYRYRAKLAAWKGEETLRFILGAALILNEGFYYWRLLYVGNGGSSNPQQLITYIPLQVCEWSAYLAAFMLMKKSRHIFDICYYICLTLGVVPFFTPAVIMKTGPAYARYYQFWIEHALPIFAVFYMKFVHGFKADIKKVYKPYALLAFMATLAVIANTNIEGANFMYLAAGTAGDSLANLLPANIWLRLLVYLVLLTLLFVLVSLPQLLPAFCAWRKRRSATPTETAETAEENAAEEDTTDITA